VDLGHCLPLAHNPIYYFVDGAGLAIRQELGVALN